MGDFNDFDIGPYEQTKARGEEMFPPSFVPPLCGLSVKAKFFVFVLVF